jgi:hypothetical protein
MFVTIFLFYFVSNLIYWLFGFKYWVISIEIPHVLQQDESGRKLCTETRYNLLNWTGILINFGACVVCAYIRAQVDYQSTYAPAPESLGRQLMVWFVIVTALLVVSAGFLADALRRLKKSF